jgi:hypothetical protein
MYKIVGADNQEYGPVSREEILQWIAQGRANAKTLARLEQGAWKPLATFDEFKAALNLPSTPPPLSGATSGFTTIPAGLPSAGAKSNTTAIVALISGILGLLCCPCIAPLVAVILGSISLKEIKANPSAYTTDASLPKIAIGLGIAGLLMSLLGVVWTVVGGGLSVLKGFSGI